MSDKRPLITPDGEHRNRPAVWWLLVGCDYLCPECKFLFRDIPEYPKPSSASTTQVPAWCLPCAAWLERVA